MRDEIPNPIDELAIVVKGVGPLHGHQHAVARMLQRQMKMRSEAARRSDQIDDGERAVHRLERADSELRSGRRAAFDCVQQLQQ